MSFVKNSKAGEDELTMLHVAAKNYRFSACKLLIEGLNIEPDIKTKSLKTPLHILFKTEKIYEKKSGVFEEKFAKSFEVLVDKKADVNAKDESQKTPFHYAVIGRNIKGVALLLNREDTDIFVWLNFLILFLSNFEKIS